MIFTDEKENCAESELQTFSQKTELQVFRNLKWPTAHSTLLTFLDNVCVVQSLTEISL